MDSNTPVSIVRKAIALLYNSGLLPTHLLCFHCIVEHVSPATGQVLQLGPCLPQFGVLLPDPCPTVLAGCHEGRRLLHHLADLTLVSCDLVLKLLRSNQRDTEEA